MRTWGCTLCGAAGTSANPSAALRHHWAEAGCIDTAEVDPVTGPPGAPVAAHQAAHQPLPTERDGYMYRSRCSCGWAGPWTTLHRAGAHHVRHHTEQEPTRA